jgi:signal transduction histidine kinase
MRLSDWFRPPRQLLIVFLAVALVSAVTLGWLGWLLLQQDAALDIQRRQDRLEQAADRAASGMQRSLSDLQTRVPPSIGEHVTLPSGVSGVSISRSGVVVWRHATLPYVPVRLEPRPPLPAVLTEGERLEFSSASDRAGAARIYKGLTTAQIPAVRAEAFARLARVRRKLGDIQGALDAYDELASIKRATVDGLPAGLVARIGRATIFEQAHRTADLRTEAEEIKAAITNADWTLTKAEYEFYSAETARWLGATRIGDVDALARAQALEWLWDNQTSLPAPQRRLLTLDAGPALLVWQTFPDHVAALIAGPKYLTAVCTDAVPADLRCALSDSEGRAIIGDRPPARVSAVRTASSVGLPWTLHVFLGSEAIDTPSPRRKLLMFVFAVVGMVLCAGWYFILRAIRREARASQLQSDFVAAVSHEFRSPLTSLSHIADLLAHRRIPAHDLDKSYDALARETARLRRLIEGLLDFGRLEAGAGALHSEPLDIVTLVRTTVAEFQQYAGREGYLVELTAPLREVLVSADREALSRALWNLLDNAIKYSPDCRTIWVEMTYDNEEIAISVRDQGLGIPVAEQHEIFNRFVRGADSKARRIKGTGIGLAMVSEIVRAHGGQVRVNSEPGRGSQFIIVLHAGGAVG